MSELAQVDTKVTILLPLQDAAVSGAISRFVDAIKREVSEWAGGQSPDLLPHLQIDVAIGAPDYAFYEFASGDMTPDAQNALVSRIESLPVPQVCELVAFSVLCNWGPDGVSELGEDWIRLPFGSLLEESNLRNAFDIKVPLYLALQQAHPDFESPLQIATVPWYERCWRFLRRQSPSAGFLDGSQRVAAIKESKPFRPTTDWVDQERLNDALEETSDQLKERLAQNEADGMSRYALALLLYQQEQFDEALEHLDRFMLQHPNEAQLHYTRAEISLENSQLEDALRHSEQAIELAPEWAAGYFLRARVYAELEAWDHAEQDYVRVTELHPTNVDGWLCLAQVGRRRGDVEVTLDALDSALQYDPYHPDALAFRIDLLPHIEYETAEEIERRIDRDLDRALKYVPRHPHFLVRQAERALTSGDAAQAVHHCNEALELDPENSAAFGLRGAAKYSMLDFDDAFNDLNRAIELGNEAPAVLHTRARIFLQREEFESAKLDCEHAIETDDTFVLAYLTLANTLAAQEDPDNALDALNKTLELAPEWDLTHRAMGDFFMQHEEFEQASAAYSKAIELDGESAINWLQRGVCEASRKDYQNAISDLSKAIELEPDFAEAHRARASVNLARHEIDDAIKDLTQVLRLIDDDVASLFQRAQCYLAKKRPTEAREDFDRVIELCPSLAAAYSGRARTWIESGDEDRAAEDFHAATMQDPVSADDFLVSHLLAEAAMLQRTEDYPAAFDKIAEAFEIDAESAQSLAIRASCYWDDEQFVEAIDDYTSLLDRLTDKDEDRFKLLACFNNRGHVYVEMGEFEKGLLDLDEAVRIAESYGSRECLAYSLSGRALAYAGLNEIAKAQEDFQRSVNTRPENAWVYYNQGLVYDKLGQPQEAATCFQLALALEEPHLPPRKRARAEHYVEKNSEPS